MDNLEFHVLFNIPDAIAQTINQMVYHGKDVVKADMIRCHTQGDIQDLLDEMNMDRNTYICHIIDLDENCAMLTFFINKENVEVRTIKISMTEGGQVHEKTN